MGLAGRTLVAVLALALGTLPVLARNQARPSSGIYSAPAAAGAPAAGHPEAVAAGEPRSLLDTGLYVTGSADEVRPGNLSFTPQYPLWSDGADKRRWLHLPPGTWVDATRPDAWEFPVGTRLWKEFSHAGKRIETRLIQRREDKSWLYASYAWNAAGTDAVLVPAKGAVLQNAAAPAGRYEVPARADCLACHEGAAVPVLGASAVQLAQGAHAPPAAAIAGSPGSDLSMMDLRALIQRGLLRNFPPSWQEKLPGIAAASATERAALGYLHGNCGHCHNHDGSPAAVQLMLAQSAEAPGASRQRVLRSALNVHSRYQPPGMPDDSVVIAPGRPEASVIERRMQSRHPLVQMPPLGTRVPDDTAVALIRRWIANDLSDNKEHLK